MIEAEKTLKNDLKNFCAEYYEKNLRQHPTGAGEIPNDIFGFRGSYSLLNVYWLFNKLSKFNDYQRSEFLAKCFGGEDILEIKEGCQKVSNLISSVKKCLYTNDLSEDDFTPHPKVQNYSVEVISENIKLYYLLYVNTFSEEILNTLKENNKQIYNHIQNDDKTKAIFNLITSLTITGEGEKLSEEEAQECSEIFSLLHFILSLKNYIKLDAYSLFNLVKFFSCTCIFNLLVDVALREEPVPLDFFSSTGVLYQLIPVTVRKAVPKEVVIKRLQTSLHMAKINHELLYLRNIESLIAPEISVQR